MSINIEQLKQGDRRTLAKAITLVESTVGKHREQAQGVLESILPTAGNSVRIGITGIPGVGKSTFIEAFGLYLIAQGKRVAVLAVDPSSLVGGGSILGDKTRMEHLSRKHQAFIRPSPTSGTLGGVGQKTRESILLCEAAGYDVVIVETVGVGQSEYQVADMVDFFMVLMLPNAGDELQGIKKGIIELADALVINKTDGDSIALAEEAQQHYKNALHLLQHDSFWQPQILTCSAKNNSNIDTVWNMIVNYYSKAKEQGFLSEKRSRQNKSWMEKLIAELLELKLKSNEQVKRQLPQLEDKVVKGEITPYSAAQKIIQLLDQ